MSAIQTDSTSLIVENASISSSFETQIIDVQQVEGYSLQIIWNDVGDIAGSLEIHCSDDQHPDITQKKFIPITRSYQQIYGTTGHHTYDINNFNYRFIKLIINVNTSSSIFNIYFNSRSRRN